MVGLKQFQQAPAAVPLRLEASPTSVRQCVGGREVRLGDVEDKDQAAQIRTENLLFKQSFQSALFAAYDKSIGARAIALALEHSPSADLESADDIYRQDVDLIIAHANDIHNQQLVEGYSS